MSKSSRTSTRCGDFIGYTWTVDAWTVDELGERVRLAVRAKKVGAIDLVASRMFAYAVYARTGARAQGLRERFVDASGVELPIGFESERVLETTVLGVRDLEKIPGATGENGIIDLVVRVRVWSNPFHVVFKHELFDALTTVGSLAYAFVVLWRSTNEMGHWRTKRRTMKKVRTPHKDDVHGELYRLALVIARVPISTAFDAAHLPLRALNVVADATTDIIVETVSFISLAVMFLAPRTNASEEAPAPDTYDDRGKAQQHHLKASKLPRRVDRASSHKSSRNEVHARHAKRASVDVLDRRLTFSQADIDAEQRRAEREAAEAREHAEAQIRAKMKRAHMRDMHVSSSRYGSSLKDRDRQESLELRGRQESLIHRMLHEIDDLDIPEEKETIDEPPTPKNQHDFAGLFSWNVNDADSLS